LKNGDDDIERLTDLAVIAADQLVEPPAHAVAGNCRFIDFARHDHRHAVIVPPGIYSSLYRELGPACHTSIAINVAQTVIAMESMASGYHNSVIP
jgi:hypothetical protein